MKHIFSLAVLLYVFGYFLHSYYVDGLDLLHLTEKQSLIEWSLRGFRDVGIIIAASIAIIFALKNYSDTENKIYAVLLVIVSIGFSLSIIINTGYAYYKFEGFLSDITSTELENPNFVSDYEDRITSNERPLSERIEFSRSIASRIYIDTGEILNVINEKNVKTAFIPPPEDQKLRMEFLNARNLLEHTAKSFKAAFIVWLGVLFLSIFIGIIAARRKKT